MRCCKTYPLRYAIVLRLNLEIAYNVLIARRFCLPDARISEFERPTVVTTSRTSIKSLLAVAALGLISLIAGCGGGGATAPSCADNNSCPVVVAPLVVNPSVLTVVQGTSALLSVDSGVAPFQVFSSNSFVLPVVQAVAGKSITLSPVNVATDTLVTLTVRDAAGQSTTVAVTVMPPVIPALVVNPTSLTVYSGIPSNLTIERGVGPFQVFSSDSLVLPVVQAVSGTSIYLFAASVTADKVVTITVRDAAGQSVTVPVTVKPVPIPSALVVTPTVLNIYSGTPSRITINSGVGPFQVFTSDAVVLPVVQSVSGAAINLTASTVSVDTVVTLTVRDSAAQTVTVVVTVKPSPVLGVLTVTQTSNSTCAGVSANTVDRAAICSGESGVASITVRSANTSVLPNRQIRFDVVQGAFNFVVDQAGTVTAKTLTIVTDQNGKADVVIRMDPGVASQAALIRATDLTSGNRVDGAFTIVQAINGASILSVLPATFAGTGGFTQECLAFSGDYVIYGGTPPYTVTSGLPNAGTLSTATNTGQVVSVAVRGGIFRFTSNYIADGCGGFTVPLTIADAAGKVTSVTFSVTAGSAARVVIPAALSPAAVAFRANIGGTPPVDEVDKIPAFCTSPGILEGSGCKLPTFTGASCTNGGTPNVATGTCTQPTVNGGTCLNASTNAAGTACLVPVFTAPPPSCSNGGSLNVTNNGCLSTVFTPTSCSLGGIVSGNGCLPATFVRATCVGGLVNSTQTGCIAPTYVPMVPGIPAIPAGPNTACSSSSVVYTINGGFVPYVLSSSDARVVPATAVVATSPSNITITFPTLSVGAVVTITAVDAKGTLFTSLATCVADS